MKKTFALSSPGKDNQRVVEAVKNEIRKYVKRERRKSLPEGVDFWDFDCKVGPDKVEPTVCHLAEVTTTVDTMAASGAAEVYVEILAKPGHRTKKLIAPLPNDEFSNTNTPETPGADESAENPPTG